MIEQVDAAEDGPSEVRIGLPNGQTLCALADPLELQKAASGRRLTGASDVFSDKCAARHTVVARCNNSFIGPL
nr:hypothetical protein GCM10020185_40690 [Pseudomonas brassicacearum subsp. brassicacearum]